MLRLIRLAASAALSLILPLAFVSAASGQMRHTVVEGDTLTGIANTFETSADTIAIANDIADPDLIIAGQVLKIQDNRIPF